MDTGDWLTGEFEQHRPRLQRLCYRMLGSRAEAEDALQDAWVRVSGSEPDDVDNPGGWLATVVARVCLNRLRSRAARPEDPAGVHVPDLVVSRDVPTPADEAVLADSVSLALLVVLDTLAPAERAGLAAGCAARGPRMPAPIARLSDAWSRRSSPPPGTGTWARWSPCSTPTLCSAPTAVPPGPRSRRCCAGRPMSPGARRCSVSRASRSTPCWSTAPRARS